ncbi:DMT family transporter [Cupriavidus oxalaticus]|jgi:drug/metabolite transporter (DMT)-like permease|uniref:DMT family transporter n=1 Tax=Cupriavidus oxalaticus TaxID=96344 RepID=A0A976G956_9BURK|nr:DMT family transporter [Cupriavidus oxalaticus]QRQ88894.1 DMT family transporter [Cupriavidus oxalaticus]QRQ92780.1 DMT family transporter [Cupriavidus oxalaticus]WQD81387.1 DMT family transporter [Cupriavidus oxalaticus]SPC12693.1 Tramsmembrane protein [Cupriavidus oxalaticus]
MGIGVLCGLLAGAFWGMVFIAPKLLPVFSPWELAIGRYLAYGLVALVAALPLMKRIARKLTRADCVALLRQAFTGNLLYYVLLAFGVQLAGVGPTSLIIGILPISVTIMGRRDHGAVPLSRLLWPLLVVAVGIACINIDLFGGGQSAHAAAAGDAVRPGWQKLAGVCAAAGALVCWTLYAVDNARYLQRNPHYSGNEWSALYGLSTGAVSAVLAVIGWLVAGDALTSGDSGRDWQWFWMVNAAVALGASLIGNNLWNIASRRLPLTLSGQMIVFETLFALAYGFIFDHRWPRPLEIAAIVLLMVGVAWSVRLHASDKSA